MNRPWWIVLVWALCAACGSLAYVGCIGDGTPAPEPDPGAAVPGATAPAESSLAVTVTGARPDGPVVVSVFRTADGFPADRARAWRVGIVAPDAGAASVRFEDVPPGRYAVAAYQDRNSNGALDTAPPFGIPREPIGVSNHPALGFRTRPDFQRALVTVAGLTKVAVLLVELLPGRE